MSIGLATKNDVRVIRKQLDLLEIGLQEALLQLAQITNIIMATKEQVESDLRDLISNAKQVNLDITEVKKKQDEALKKIAELEKIIADGGVPDSVANLVGEAKALVIEANESLPDPVPVPEPPPANP